MAVLGHGGGGGATIMPMPNHVIVSTLGWSRRPLEEAIAGIAGLDFGQVDLAVHEGWAHVNPSELVAGGPARVRQEAERIRELIRRHEMKRVAAFNVGLRADSPAEERRRLGAVCDLAAALEVPVITLGASPRGTPLEDEIARLQALLPEASGRGVTLTLETHTRQLTEHPAAAAQLCEALPGLGLTLDASHYHAGPNAGADYASVLPHVRHVHLRDAGADWERIQVPPGVGLVDFGQIVRQLHGVRYGGKFAIEYIDSIPIAPGPLPEQPARRAGAPGDIPSNIIRMRDIFVAAEREAGIVRAPAT